MALLIKPNGRILCAALNEQKDRDTYIDDETHYYLSVIKKVIVTTESEHHLANGGEWWWKGQEPKDVVIEPFYYISNHVEIINHDTDQQRT